MGVAGEIKDTNKILGLGWKVQGDVMHLIGHFSSPKIITKREILRCISKLLDPLGFMLPVTIRSRMFLQEIWRTQSGWGDVLPVEFVNLWEDLYKDLMACYHIYFQDSCNSGLVILAYIYSVMLVIKHTSAWHI